MAESNARRKTVDKWKKKKWFTIKASKTFDGKVLGETPAERPINLINRTIKVSMDRLTGQRAKRDIIIYFKTKDVQGQTINTSISKFEIAKSSLGRLVRRRNSKVALVSRVPCQGGDAIITLIAVTARKATQSQKTGIREVMDTHIKKLADKDFEFIVKELLNGKFVGDAHKDAAKVFMVKKLIAAKAFFKETK